MPCRQRQRRNVTNGSEERGARAGGRGSRARSRVGVRRVLADECALSLLGGNSDASTLDAVAVVATVVDLTSPLSRLPAQQVAVESPTWLRARIVIRAGSLK